MDKRLWWEKPLRVIQTNLQVRDTMQMNPDKIAHEIEEMAGNVLVTNVGGIYAWYQSNVRYHHMNEFLPQEFDLLHSLIDACHKRGIRVVARFDFSKTDDYVYQEKPGWFVRNPDRSPHAYGTQRPGDWSLLYTTCINGGYRNDDVAVPVIWEVLDRYDIDGVFFNAPQYERCYCDSCRKKYRVTYGEELPLDLQTAEGHPSPTLAWRSPAQEMHADWPSRCVRDNIEKIYRAIKEKRADMPMILYYNMYNDNLNDRTATADLLCTEPQDVLSLGHKEIPPFWKPALSIRIGRTIEHYPAPFGIIHSCPGMDWRHTGLPPAEHLFWMAQIPANGGQIWHSLTGFNDTISDKRLLRSVSTINHMIAHCETEMDGAESAAQTLLMWNAQASAEGWAEGLMSMQEPFDVLDGYQMNDSRMERYRVAIAPEGTHYTPEKAALLERFVLAGGNLIVEGISGMEAVAALLGVETDMGQSEYLAASYWQFEEAAGTLREGFEDTPLLAQRGVVAYCTPKADTQVLATLVPPFAPLDAVGAPPERASIRTTHTDLPLCTLHTHGKGKVLFLPFQLSMLARTYKLGEHYRLMRNCVRQMLGEEQLFCVEAVCGIQAMIYRNTNSVLVHFVNGIGQRPLCALTPYHALTFTLHLANGETVHEVLSSIAGEPLAWRVENGVLTCTIPTLGVWDMITIRLDKANA